MRKIIDVHVHLSNSKEDVLIDYARANGLQYSLKELLDTMEKFNVANCLLLSPPLKNGKPLGNYEILKLCNESMNKLLPVVTVEPSYKSVNEALDIVKKASVKGFKIRLGYNYIEVSSKFFERVYDFAEKNGIPVLFHTGDTATKNGSLIRSHPLNIDELSNRRPKLKVVVCHFGNPWFETTAEIVYKHEHVYADISGLFSGGSSYTSEFKQYLADKLSHSIYYIGSADKILFGTDYPVSTYQDTISLVENLKIKEEDKIKIYYENAKRLFNL